MVGLLGRGGMGLVLAVHDPQLDRVVALKLIHGPPPREGWGVTRLHEAQAMARLAHPNVVAVYEAGFLAATPYVVMERIEGCTLRAWLGARRRRWPELQKIMLAVGRGLAAAHRAGIVHRDFKPDNVLVGEDARPRVSDFGLSSFGTEPGGGGTAGYMPPEQVAGELVDARADQYAFCVTLWEALYGARPRPSPTRAPDRGRAPASVYRAIARGLRARPEERWPSMDALLAALRPSRSRRAAAGLAAAAALVLWLGWPRPEAPAALRLVQLTHRRDLQNARISPDGATLALVDGDALVLRGVDPGVEDRVIIEHGVSPAVLEWSPDRLQLAIALVPESPSKLATEIVDLEGHVRYLLPVRGLTTFLSNTEVAVTSYLRRDVDILALGATATPVARCAVPGDYLRIEAIDGRPDGTIVVRTTHGSSGGLVILARDCRVLGTYEQPKLTGGALTDTGTAVVLVDHDGYSELVEVSFEGAVRSRRKVSGEVWMVLGRRRGIDYVLTTALETYLDRLTGASPPRHLFSSFGAAEYALSPRGDRLAWIELGTHNSGPLRLSTLAAPGQRGAPVLAHAMRLSWSPSGRSLAALVDDRAGLAVVVVDVAGRAPRRLPLGHLEANGEPVWLSEHRVAAQTDDLLTYAWFDLDTGELGDLFDRAHGGTYWLARSPRDGTLAVWRTGASASAGHLWLASPGHALEPLAVEEPVRSVLLPSWSPAGDLFVRSYDRGTVSRIALDTGKPTVVARPAPDGFDDHLQVLPDGDLLTTSHERNVNVAAIGAG